MDEHMERKRNVGMKWIRGESGASYLCSLEAIQHLKNPSEADLQRYCVDESHNPQND